MLNSSWTGRAPRDMESAFGAHIRSSQCQIVPMGEELRSRRVQDWVLYLIGVVVVVLLIGGRFV